MIASMVPVKHQKLVIHIRKMNRRQKNKKQAKADKGEPEVTQRKGGGGGGDRGSQSFLTATFNEVYPSLQVETDVKKHHKPR